MGAFRKQIEGRSQRSDPPTSLREAGFKKRRKQERGQPCPRALARFILRSTAPSISVPRRASLDGPGFAAAYFAGPACVRISHRLRLRHVRFVAQGDHAAFQSAPRAPARGDEKKATPS